MLQDSQCNYNINNVERSRNHCSCEKAIHITYSECVFVALNTQHIRQMHDIATCGLSILQYFSKLSHERSEIRENYLT